MIRLEAFNVFNHINLGNPAVAIDNPATVARITGMVGTPRQLQLSVRFGLIAPIHRPDTRASLANAGWSTFFR